MPEPVSCESPRYARRRDEDEAAVSSVAPPKETPAPTSGDRLVSAAPVDWQSVPTMCDANAVDAASTNAARTAQRDILKGVYAAAGKTSDGKSAFVGAAVMKGRTAQSVEGEALSVSGQLGAQNELQATFARFGYAGMNVSGSAEAFTAYAHLGVDNSDGSKGVNAGAQATMVAGELTLKHSGSSVTAGLSAGVGVEAHIGVRDEDKDGTPEYCARVAVGPFIAGVCIERPVVIKP